MIYESVCREARAISSHSLARPLSPIEWKRSLRDRRKMWLEMLGLDPLPRRTDMHLTVTGTLDRGDYVVEKLHFQCLPKVYVAGNLYRPKHVRGKLPTVLYLCGHTTGKAAPTYQARPRWFAQHGYVSLVLDTIEQGENQGDHHGTYTHGRWDWMSRGYTPAGTETWIAMRALDYLETRDDVDAERMGVTGLSGGGVISWCLGAADERVKVVAPTCQTGSVEQIAVDRATDGHCDCAFWINYYRWCTPDLGALIAPRALLVTAGTEDGLWRPYAFRDACHRIAQQYDALGASGNFELVEDRTPHGYTPKLDAAIFGWFNRHLKGDDSPVTEGVTDYVEPAENLSVYGGQAPRDDRMAEVDKLLVRAAVPPKLDDAETLRRTLDGRLMDLKLSTFGSQVSDCRPALVEFRADGADEMDPKRRRSAASWVFDTGDGLRLRLRTLSAAGGAMDPMLVCAMSPDARHGYFGGGPSRPWVGPGIATGVVEVRSTGATSVGPGYLWTLRRVYQMLGHTLPERQVADLLAGLRLIYDHVQREPHLALYGEGYTAVLAIYAALVGDYHDGRVEELVLRDPPETHTDPTTPELLGVLRVGDLPQNLALFAPRPITFVGAVPPAYEWTREAYARLGAPFRVLERLEDWRPLPVAEAGD